MHLLENAEITIFWVRLIAISMGNMSFSNPVESAIWVSAISSGTFRYQTLPNLYGFV